MELIGLLLLICLAWVFLKILGAVFHVTFFALTLPFQIIGIVLAVLFSLVILIPLGIVGAIFGVLLAPFALLGSLLPVVLIILGIILIARNS